VADLHPDPRTFEGWLRSVLRRNTDEGGVLLSTVHRVKGMEWDRVAVTAVTAGVIPHRLATDTEEERRVLHVAITRARHQAVVLADAERPSAFLAELDGTAPHRPASAPTMTRAAAPARSKKPSTLEARVGLDHEANGGFRGAIAETTDEGVHLALGTGARLFVRYGETMTVRGRSVTLAPVPDLPAEVIVAEDALRAWRLERCRTDKVSAFIVASNAVLRAIATRRPATLEELASIDGIGPTKLDLYGDDILAVLESLSS
jgi:DNA helicase-2/ATP-dependent DNA helicase PcrA